MLNNLSYLLIDYVLKPTLFKSQNELATHVLVQFISIL